MNIDINNLCVDVDNKHILNDFSLHIKKGEIHALMGPNGTGKSTLSKVIMGFSDYCLIKGDILINGESIKGLPTDVIAKKGVFLVYQNPISINGLSNSEFIRTALNEKSDKKVGLYDFIKTMENNLNDLKMNEEMMHRSLNQGFSGGERKKNEILQMKMLKPSFIIFDELDSGLDVDSLKIVCDNINNYIKENPNTSVLLITHYVRILEYIHPQYVHMMKDGQIVCSGDYDLALKIEKYGYNKSFALGENKDDE